MFQPFLLAFEEEEVQESANHMTAVVKALSVLAKKAGIYNGAYEAIKALAKRGEK